MKPPIFMTITSLGGGAAISAASWVSPFLAVLAVLAVGGGLVAIAVTDQRRRRNLPARLSAELARHQGGER